MSEYPDQLGARRMSGILKPRPYQREAIDAVFRAWDSGVRRPAVVLATGLGKTHVFSHLIAERTGLRSIILVHRDELASQAADKIRSIAPGLSVGVVKAQDNDIYADVMICSVQTIAREGRRRTLVAAQKSAGPVGLLVTDEVHHCPSKSYQDIYADFPEAKWLGVTATLERGDGVGLGSQVDEVVFSRSVLWGIKHGYLVQPRAFTEDASGLDLKSVKRSGGDYSAGDLGRALEEAEVAESLPAVWKEHAADRPTLVFTPTVATAHGTAEAFRSAGITSAVVSGETPREERRRIFDDFRTGKVTVLCNCMVLTEGFDAPWASCAVIARPTRSRPLYAQMVGRVLRPWQGKTDAVVINVAGGGGKISTLVDLAPGAVKAVKEGEGLLEAEEREELEDAAESEKAAVHKGHVLRMKEVTSLFEASHQAWLRTAGGVMFLSAGEYTYFLWANPETPGAWDVCRKRKYGKWERTAHTGLSAEMAMSWAEAEAEDHGSFSVARKASWRGKSVKPSQAQKDFAQQIGVGVPDTMSKAELSDAISYVLESRALDPYLGVV